MIHQIETLGLKRIRFAWCDLHGALRSKTLMVSAALRALDSGVGMAGTLLLKDHADKTAYPVFDARAMEKFPALGRFVQASNVLLKPVPASLKVLPWDRETGLLCCEAFFPDGTPVFLDTRRVLREALEKLSARGLMLKCGLEVEFHVYRIRDVQDQLDPARAAWPGMAPALEMLHPGYRLIGDDYMSMCEVPMAIIEQTALALGLPLQSLEIEFGPSQLEAVFDVTDALSAADNMVLFRNLVRQALRRAGYYASFVCRPPFPNIMSSGWHLHQSLSDSAGNNLFTPVAPDDAQAAGSARYLSQPGTHYLAGLLAHAPAMAALAVPTVNGYERFRPNALAPQTASWGPDSRSAMLRVIGGPGDPATRIENRLGEPMANPYLYLASQIHAGLEGMDRALKAPPAEGQDLANAVALPARLDQSLGALQASAMFRDGLGADFVDCFVHIHMAEWARYQAAEDRAEFQSREYFSRF